MIGPNYNSNTQTFY